MSLIRRRKLTKRQTRQIEQNQTVQADDTTFAEGVIVSHFGKQPDVQITNLPTVIPSLPDTDTNKHTDANKPLVQIGTIWRCHARTNLPMLCYR